MKENNEKQCDLEKSPSSNERTASKITTQPVFTSTPILMRNEGNNANTSQSILSVFNRIDQLDSNIKAVKRDIILQMEKKLDDLKSSVVSIIEGLYTDVSYADAVKRTCAANSSTQSPIENSRNASVSRFVDEGFADTTLINVDNSSSQTQLKTVATSQNIVQRNSAKINSQRDVERISTQEKSQPAVQRNSMLSNPQPVPVRVTNRNNLKSPIYNQNRASSSYQPKRILIIGSSILKGINYRGLRKGVKICSRPGARVPDLLEELSIYDLKSFEKIIICIGGNDCASKVHVQAFQDKYNELISFIKNANESCTVYLGKILPRGDVDVTEFNRSIQRVAGNWAKNHVQYIDDTHNLFFGRNGLPWKHYYTNDGIHLSNSGVKRLLDAINRHVDIVKDFQSCVYKNVWNVQYGSTTHDKSTRKTSFGNRVQPFNKHRRDNSRFCYGCSLAGHFIEECWYSNSQ